MSVPVGRSAREQAEFKKICWPETEVFRNKLGIRDARELELAERYLVAQRVRQSLPVKATPNSYAGFKAIHHHLFQDVYDWAGQERRYTSGRGPASFAPPENIASWLETQFERLKSKRFLFGASKETFSEEAAVIVNEINAAHPFIEGNGRTQRTWLRALAAQAGHRLSFSSEDRERWNDASRIGFEAADHEPMIKLLQDRIRGRDKEQERGTDRTIRRDRER